MSLHLIIGASGQVGEHLLHASNKAGIRTVGTYYTHPAPGMQPLNLQNKAEVMGIVTSLQPSIIFLPASLTNVDYCETHPSEGYAANVTGVGHVVQAANAAGAKLVYFSSDYIFDGKAGPYTEEDPANPICEYGRHKVLAEHYISLHAKDYLIIRTTVVYGWEHQGKNFIYRLLNTLKSGKTIQVPVDQIGSPTYAPNLSQATLQLALKGAMGVYHIVGPELASRYAFAREAARVFGLDESLIQPVTTLELKQAAQRPLKAGMMVDKVSSLLDFPLLDYKNGLITMAEQKRKES